MLTVGSASRSTPVEIDTLPHTCQCVGAKSEIVLQKTFCILFLFFSVAVWKLPSYALLIMGFDCPSREGLLLRGDCPQRHLSRIGITRLAGFECPHEGAAAEG